jgi:hypothetical protein
MSVHGHNRSGTHYLKVLLKVNFNVLGQEMLGHHSFPGKWVHEGKIKFCIKRDFLGVADSMWDLRKHFGIGASTLEDFMDTPWVKQWKTFPPSELDRLDVCICPRCCDVVAPEVQDDDTEVCPLCSFELGRPSKRRTKLISTLEEFRNCALTPREYHSQYVDEWENFSSNNLFIVNYDLLLSEFEEEMLRIAERVGSDKVSFTNLAETGPSPTD